MKKLSILFLLISCVFNIAMAQIKYETFKSFKLQEDRQIKIQLPRSYNSSTDKSYPLFVVLDGDYLFEIVAGNVDYCSYWEEMPEAIVVGINQVAKRYDDTMYSPENSLPIETGAKFFEFIGGELIPHLQKNYRVGSFKVAVGHGNTANFINYYLLKSAPLFNAYISLSPDIAPDMLGYMKEALGKIQTTIFYYLANTNNTPPTITQMIDALNTDLSTLNNKNVLYNFKRFEGPSFYALPAYAIPGALESIFKAYQPITRKEYFETIVKLEGSPTEYLLEKYKTIEDLYGIKKQVLINDFMAISKAIETNKTFEAYEELSKLAREHYPKTLLGGYYLARFYEETGETFKAMRAYQAAFILDEIAGIKKEVLLEKADAIKSDFGYD